MRLILLEILAVVAALVFLSMMGAIASHRSASRVQGLRKDSAVSEYLWAVVPWLMIAACVLPAVRRILALD
jgi:heme/copper-type cytochrome/quinol oxidase subunit 2